MKLSEYEIQNLPIKVIKTLENGDRVVLTIERIIYDYDRIVILVKE